MDKAKVGVGSHPVLPLAYERPVAEAIPGAFRDGKYLVVRRGANLSRFCLCCGRPANGKPIVKRLWLSSGVHTASGGSGASGIFAILQIIILLFGLFVLASEWLDSRKRKVTFGLCQPHYTRRLALMAGAWAAFIGSIAALIVGVHLMPTASAAMQGTRFWMAVALIVAAPLLGCATFFLGYYVPSLGAYKEVAGELWLKGAYPPFLDAQTKLPPT